MGVRGSDRSDALGLGERCRLRSLWHHSVTGIVLVLATVNVQIFHFKDKAWPRRAAMGLSVPGQMSPAPWFGAYFHMRPRCVLVADHREGTPRYGYYEEE